jgi:hypothetical protein
MGTTANQRKLFFKLRTAKRRTPALEDGDLRPDQGRVIATALELVKLLDIVCGGRVERRLWNRLAHRHSGNPAERE